MIKFTDQTCLITQKKESSDLPNLHYQQPDNYLGLANLTRIVTCRRAKFFVKQRRLLIIIRTKTNAVLEMTQFPLLDVSCSALASNPLIVDEFRP